MFNELTIGVGGFVVPAIAVGVVEWLRSRYRVLNGGCAEDRCLGCVAFGGCGKGVLVGDAHEPSGSGCDEAMTLREAHARTRGRRVLEHTGEPE